MKFTRGYNPKRTLNVGVYDLADRILKHMNEGRGYHLPKWMEVEPSIKGSIVSWGYCEKPKQREICIIRISEVKSLYPDLYQERFIDAYTEEKRSTKYPYIILYNNKNMFGNPIDSFGFNTIEGWLNDSDF